VIGAIVILGAAAVMLLAALSEVDWRWPSRRTVLVCAVVVLLLGAVKGCEVLGDHLDQQGLGAL
jgi:cytochrome c oxidase assembly factor CtaG